MGYRCKYGLYHDKPVRNHEPSSNNGWIYSAYANALGVMPLNVDQLTRLKRTFDACNSTQHPADGIFIDRLPGKKTPPLSHDEIIGMYCLGQVPYSWLKRNHFVFHGKGMPMNVKTIKQILKGIAQLYLLVMIKGKHHRNLFWQKKVVNLYQAAFRLHPAHVYFLKRCEGIKPHEEERVIWKLYVKCTLENGSAGEKNLLWLQAHKMGDKKLMRKCKRRENFVKYFGAEHIFNTVAINE